MAKVKTTQREAKSKSGTETDPKVTDALASEAEHRLGTSPGRLGVKT